MAAPSFNQVVLIGGPELVAALRRAGSAGLRAGAGALFREAERIMAVSKQIVPVDTGNLRNTAHVALPEVSGHMVEIVLGYGGPAAPYAIFVHENLAARHRSGQYAKFLEFPALQSEQGMEARLAAEIRREIEAVGR